MFLILLAMVWKVADAEVLKPLPVIALAISDFPLLTDVFKLSTSLCFASSIEVPDELVPKNFDTPLTKVPCVRIKHHLFLGSMKQVSIRVPDNKEEFMDIQKYIADPDKPGVSYFSV